MRGILPCRCSYVCVKWKIWKKKIHRVFELQPQQCLLFPHNFNNVQYIQEHLIKSTSYYIGCYLCIRNCKILLFWPYLHMYSKQFMFLRWYATTFGIDCLNNSGSITHELKELLAKEHQCSIWTENGRFTMRLRHL